MEDSYRDADGVLSELFVSIFQLLFDLFLWIVKYRWD